VFFGFVCCDTRSYFATNRAIVVIVVAKADISKDLRIKRLLHIFMKKIIHKSYSLTIASYTEIGHHFSIKDMNYSHLGNEMFPHWEQNIPSLGISVLP
jgi:hypothetical protein